MTHRRGYLSQLEEYGIFLATLDLDFYPDAAGEL